MGIRSTAENTKNGIVFAPFLPNDSLGTPAIIRSAVTKRRSLTPIAGMPPVLPGTHAMRRGDARKEVSDRVTVRALPNVLASEEGPVSGTDGGKESVVTTSSTIKAAEGWALNASRGGFRAIVETNESGFVIELGGEYEVIVGDPEEVAPKKARAVWVQDEPDGIVVGFEYIGLSGTHRAAISSGPPAPLSNAFNASDSVNIAKAPAVTLAEAPPSADDLASLVASSRAPFDAKGQPVSADDSSERESSPDPDSGDLDTSRKPR